MKMMNLEEGFRRIGVSTVVVSLFFGIVTAFLCSNILVGVMVTAVLIAFFFLLLRLTVYVIKGFVTKDNDSEK
jgi:hypothetical protein